MKFDELNPILSAGGSPAIGHAPMAQAGPRSGAASSALEFYKARQGKKALTQARRESKHRVNLIAAQQGKERALKDHIWTQREGTIIQNRLAAAGIPYAETRAAFDSSDEGRIANLTQMGTTTAKEVAELVGMFLGGGRRRR